ncbi:SGNH/GDSL hydrolase family protein [uncultured Roseivirga sp.]|uniref:SGNH/GDSL hydrolase family protein n=1 Tax=uncultured Roseivirga sp. TaxID=543088 RepID=UPI000D797EB0|nr:SGNH/GDSL hydrolase family protein [uncultured Roseivirga sp.]PWL28418.1 MAG: lysophospholipase [Roseivirga sp. XM-24bin3]
MKKITLKLIAIGLIFCTMACSSVSNSSSMNRKNNNSPLNYLALGDSYTIGESVAESERWPVQLAERLRADGIAINDPKIIATTGWRTDQLKGAIEKDDELLETYDLVSLLIGVNNQYQNRSVESFAPEFEELLQKSIELAGGNTNEVFVVSIPDYGKTPFGASKAEKIAKELNEYNRVSKEICEKYKVEYFNITPISRQADPDAKLVAEDNLHPSGEQYRQWVESFYKEVKKIAKQ